MPRSPSAPKEPYLKCSSSFAKISFSSRKNFIHVNHAPDASKITIPSTEIHTMRFVFDARLIRDSGPTPCECDARTRAHSQSLREISQQCRLDFAGRAFGVRCVFAWLFRSWRYVARESW